MANWLSALRARHSNQRKNPRDEAGAPRGLGGGILTERQGENGENDDYSAEELQLFPTLTAGEVGHGLILKFSKFALSESHEYDSLTSEGLIRSMGLKFSGQIDKKGNIMHILVPQPFQFQKEKKTSSGYKHGLLNTNTLLHLTFRIYLNMNRLADDPINDVGPLFSEFIK